MKKTLQITFNLFGLALAVFFITACATESDEDSFDVNIHINAADELGDLQHIWRFFGADEPNYAYMENGKKLLKDLGGFSPGNVYFRAHSLLCTGDGTPALKWGSTNIYTEDEQGNPIYSWNIIDSIFDAYLENGVRPYVQIGFMPEALSTNPEPYKHQWNPSLPYGEIFTGWAFPPKDYNKWEELVYQWTKHCVEKYGKEEVEQWYWETWNEANGGYWQGTVEEFNKLHDYAINGVLRALPTARVGGPDVAGYGGEFTRTFLDHCLDGTNYATGETGTQLDFIAFHAKGRPVFDSGYVQMNMARQLKTIDNGFQLITSYPKFADLPIVIGESDPEGCAACQGDQLGYRNGTMYSSYTAASFVRKLDLALKHNVNLEGALTWAFEFEDQPYFAGFRALSTNGINKPVLNVFKMFSMMEGKRIAVSSDAAIPLDKIVEESVRENPDVSAYASIDGGKLYIMVWHYHDNDVPGPTSSISLQLANLPVESGKATMDTYLIDQNHSNSYTTWLDMGSPQDPSPEQYRELEESSILEKVAGQKKIKVNQSQANIELTLHRQGVTLLVLDIE
jgi:xylan 1,4-beta-xylosidase